MSNTTDNEAQPARPTYIHHILRFNHDPFSLFSAEQEFTSEEVGPQKFYNYFVEPQVNLLKNLAKPEHSLVYAEAGHGKTTLRYHLEASLRAVFTKTAVVSLKLEESTLTQSDDERAYDWLHWFVADLFIQAIEQFPQFSETLQQPELIRQFAELLSAAGWQREIQRYTAKPLVERQQTGISAWWPVWARPIIQLIPLTDEREAFLQAVAQALPTAEVAAQGGEAWFKTAVALARQIGFEHIFLAVDVVGTLTQVEDIQLIWAKILALVEVNDVWLKAFLPINYQTLIKTPLTKAISSFTMSWSEQALHQLMSHRFRSGGSRTPSLAWHAEPDFAPQLDSLLVESAHRSPRRLLQAINNLIEVHLKGDPNTAYITAEDWQATVESWRNIVIRPPHLPKMKQDYKAILFVDRHELPIALEWVNGPRRTMILTSPPKTGKSWFLRYLAEQLQEREKPIFIDILDYLPQGELDIRKLADELSRQLLGMPFNPLADILAHMEKISQAIKAPKLIIFDGLDDLHRTEEWEFFQDQILLPLHRNLLLRFILALREEFKLDYNIKKDTFDLVLNPFESEQGNEQIKKLSGRPLATILEQYQLDLQYDGHHPGTNTFVVSLPVHPTNSQKPTFPIDKYLDAFEVIPKKVVNERDKVKLLLKVIVSLENEEWTISEFGEGYQMIMEEALSPMEQSSYILFLQDHNLVLQSNPPLYKLIPGLSILRPILRRI